MGHVIQWIWQFLPSASSHSQDATLLPADLFWQHAPLPSTLADRTTTEPRSPSTFSVDDVPAMSSRTADHARPSLMALPDWCTRAGSAVSFRKEVIQPQVPLRLPCYDLVPIAEFILDAWALAVPSAASDAPHFRGLTGGVYKAQEHIHRGMLTRDY